MSTSEEIFREAMMLSPEVRAQLAERLIGSLAEDVPPEIAASQFAEVQRRIAQVETGEVELIPGDEILARARRLIEKTTPTTDG
ncbi:MAG: addiction module protein [Pyrinomonadaceae bacterium]